MSDAVRTATVPQFDLDARWRVHPKVAIRPEPFGALLYHFGTRKLSFLKNPTIVTIVSSLPEHASAAEAIRAAGVESASVPAYARALRTLAESNMLVAEESEVLS